jgi:predicted site-specific integrase-resolvase
MAVVTISEFMDRYRVRSRTTVYNWIKEGRVESFRTPGGQHRIKVGDCDGKPRTHNLESKIRRISSQV